MHNFFSRECKCNWNESTLLCCQLELMNFAAFHSAWFVNHSFINARWILNFSSTCNSSQIMFSASIQFYSLILWNIRINVAFLFFFFLFCQNWQNLQCWGATVIKKTLEKNVENCCKLVGVLLCIINFTLPIVLLWKAQNGDAPHCHR